MADIAFNSTYMAQVNHSSAAAVEMLLSERDAIDKKAFHKAIEDDNVAVVKVLLKGTRVKADADDHYVLELAAENAIKFSKMDVIEFFLFGKKSTYYYMDSDTALYIAAKNGYENLLTHLLQDDRVKPKKWEYLQSNALITTAAALGNAGCVKILLEDGRLDPSLNNNSAIRYAMGCDVVQALMSDKRVDPSAGNSSRLTAAVRDNENNIVELLITDHRVLPTDDILRYAAREGNFEAVRMFLKHFHFSQGCIVNTVRAAISLHRLTVVPILLPKVDAKMFPQILEYLGERSLWVTHMNAKNTIAALETLDVIGYKAIWAHDGISELKNFLFLNRGKHSIPIGLAIIFSCSKIPEAVARELLEFCAF